MKTLVLVWADGTKETVSYVYKSIRSGVMQIEIGRHEWRSIPLVNLREWQDKS